MTQCGATGRHLQAMFGYVFVSKLWFALESPNPSNAFPVNVNLNIVANTRSPQ
jgi:hypothetical protein